MQAIEIARWGCGGFFLLALLTGCWKYVCIVRSEDSHAPNYVNIAHRAAFMYAFACLVLEHFAALSRWSNIWNAWGVGIALFFFATAQGTYILHGLLKDTDNQLAKPYTLGSKQLPGFCIHGYMGLLILGEIGGFLIVFTGAMF